MKGVEISEIGLTTAANPVGIEGDRLSAIPIVIESSEHNPATSSILWNENKAATIQQSQQQLLCSFGNYAKNERSPATTNIPSTATEELPCHLKAMVVFRRVGQFMATVWRYIRSMSRGTWIRLGVLALIVASLFIAIGVLQKFGAIQAMFKWIDSIGYIGLLMIVAVFQLTALPVSTLYSLICVSSGFLYGIWIGTAACFGGATLAATTGFFASRYLCRGWVQKKIEENPIFQNVDEIVGKEGFKLLFFIRFVPLPFGWVNSVMAATKMRYPVFIVASMLGLAPEMMALVYVGTTIKTLSEAFEGGHKLDTTQIVLLVVEILAAIICLIVCTMIGRKAVLKIRAMRASKLEEVTPCEEDNTTNISLDLKEPTESNSSFTTTTTTATTTTTIHESTTSSSSSTPDNRHSLPSDLAASNSFPIEVVIENNRWVFDTASEQNSRRNSVFSNSGIGGSESDTSSSNAT